MAIGAHLRAASHQRMRIDHSAVAHPGSSVDEHRRHTGDALADVTTIANTGSAGDDPNAILRVDAFYGESGLVEPGLTDCVDGHVHGNAHAKAKQNAFLHPRIHAPSGFGGRIGLGRANFTGVQCLFELLKELEMFFAVSLRALVEELLDLSLHARSGRPSIREYPAPFQSLRDLVARAGTSEAATPVRAIPLGLAPPLPESGSTPQNSHPSEADICLATRARRRSRWPSRIAQARSSPREFRWIPRK